MDSKVIRVPKFEVTKTIEAPRDWVFAQWDGSNFENFPRMLKVVRSAKLIKKEGDLDVFEMEMEAMGRKMRTTTTRRHFPPGRYEDEMVTHGLGTSRSVWNFKVVPGGTEVTYSLVDLKAKSALGKLFAGRITSGIRKLVDEDMETAKLWIEANKPK